eukprot:m.4267 g.4267  ORF g.4267 m.4267 type:complete len:305 (+) comp10472_c0_seq1:38-952(+)
MSAPKRRKVTFQTSDESEKKKGKPSRLKEKHSLDSDEEDEKKEGGRDQRMKEDDIEGEEERTIDFTEGGVRVTPFNLKEEMEEGYFDADGHYIASKDEEGVEDSWMESVDWKQVYQKSADRELDALGEDSDGSEEDVESVDQKALMKEILDILKPGETVSKALRRLGGEKKKRIVKSKYSLEEEGDENGKGKGDEDRSSLLKLTGLADQLLGAGLQDIYSFSYEKMMYEVNQGGSEKLTTEEVLWYYKWENVDDAEVFGPYSSQQMMNWSEQDFFKSGVWVRKATDSQGNFYTSKRIDFALYVE